MLYILVLKLFLLYNARQRWPLSRCDVPFRYWFVLRARRRVICFLIFLLTLGDRVETSRLDDDLRFAYSLLRFVDLWLNYFLIFYFDWFFLG